MVGDMVNFCLLHSSKVYVCGVAFTSHFEKPNGFSVWLATIV